MPYLSCVPPNPNFIEVTNRLLMAMPIAPHMGFDIADVAPGRFEITQPFRPALSFREGGSTRVPSAPWPTWRRPAQVRRCCLMAVAASIVDYTLKLLAPAVGDVLVARATDTKPRASSQHSVNRPSARGLETDQSAGRLGR